ncbi:hypothetical protein C8R46DRAFT_1351698 [Mycena filopes]|nr:hypothetical protein C8R46DRAFT_1351698 [Mycena filopes]
MLNLSLPLLVIALLTKLIASTPCNQLANFCPLKDRLNQDLLTDGTTSTVASASGSSCAYKADSGNNVCVYSNPTSTTDADTCTLTLTSGTAACPSHIGDAPPNECPFTNKDALLLIGFEPVLGSQLCTYLAGVEADSFQPCNYLQAGTGNRCTFTLNQAETASKCPSAALSVPAPPTPAQGSCPGHSDGAQFMNDIPADGFFTCKYADGSSCVYAEVRGEHTHALIPTS